MKKTNNILWGILLVAIGVIVALNAFDITDIDMFFDGWWTLIIIIPCLIGLFTDREKTGNIIGICVGVFLLLCCRDIISFDMLWKLLLPAIVIFIGIKMILNGLSGNKSSEILKSLKENGAELKNGNATFSGTNVSFDGEVFQGAELNAVFGGVSNKKHDKSKDNDYTLYINATCMFGGIDIK